MLHNDLAAPAESLDLNFTETLIALWKNIVRFSLEKLLYVEPTNVVTLEPPVMLRSNASNRSVLNARLVPVKVAFEFSSN